MLIRVLLKGDVMVASDAIIAVAALVSVPVALRWTAVAALSGHELGADNAWIGIGPGGATLVL